MRINPLSTTLIDAPCGTLEAPIDMALRPNGLHCFLVGCIYGLTLKKFRQKVSQRFIVV